MMKTVMQKSVNKKSIQGLSLIEILVTVVVLSIGLLGIAGMQAQGVKYSHDSYARSQANMLANELLERMHANPDGVENGDYKDATNNAALNCSAAANDPGHPANAAPDCLGAGAGDVCTVTELAQLDYFRIRCGQFMGGAVNGFLGGVEHLLPNGSIEIDCSDADPADGIACTDDTARTVTITWQDPDNKGDPNQTLQVQMNARLL